MADIVLLLKLRNLASSWQVTAGHLAASPDRGDAQECNALTCCAAELLAELDAAEEVDGSSRLDATEDLTLTMASALLAMCSTNTTNQSSRTERILQRLEKVVDNLQAMNENAAPPQPASDRPDVLLRATSSPEGNA